MKSDSSAGFALARYRKLLDDLRAGIEARRKREQELAELDVDSADPAAGRLAQELSRLENELGQELAQAEEQYAQAKGEIEERFANHASAAEGEYRRTLQQLQQRYASETAAVERQHEENRWMMSSILDDESENSPKRQYESLKSQIQQSREYLGSQWDVLQRLHDDAVALAADRRVNIGVEPEPPQPPATRDEALARFDAASLTAQENFTRLQRQMLPRLFAGWTFLLVGLAVWGGVFAAAYFTVDPASLVGGAGPSARVVVSGAAGLIACVVTLLITYGMAVRQTRSAAEPLVLSVAEAHASRQDWLRLAKDDVQQRERDFQERYAAIVAHREGALEKFATTRTQRLAELESEREQGLRAAAEKRTAGLRAGTEQRDRDTQALDEAHRSRTAALHAQFGAERNRLTQAQDQRTRERQERRTAIWNALAENWIDAIARLARGTTELQDESRQASPGWDKIAGPQWDPAEEIPPGIRIGDYRLNLEEKPGAIPEDERLAPHDKVFALPAVLPFPDDPSLLLKAAGAGRSQAVAVLQVAMLRLLALLPPGKVRFTVLDPVGLGENFAAFMHLADFDDLLISSRIWTETAHIEQQLSNLTEHMENVFQKYLRNEFETIEEYNEHAGEVAEPYRILVVANFPAGFSERAAQRLVSIAGSGARCGVYTLVSVDMRQPLPRGFELANLEPGATVLDWKDDRFVNRKLGPEPLPLIPDQPPQPSQFAAIVRRIGDLSKNVRRVEVPFRRIAPAEDRCWAADSRASIDVPLGRAGATKLQFLRLGIGTSQHVLVAGKTGSGKSTLLHVIITNLALHYSPDEIEFYLIDFKKGVEFKTYAAHRLAHARVIAIESDREFGTSALERLDAVLKERGDLFREHGVQDVEAFREARPDVRMPRILLIVDEFQEFFVEDDRYSQTAALLLDRLVRQGRAFGIHVLLGSQTLGGAYSLARTTIGQMAVRIALQCSETDAHLILSEENSAARLLTRPGEAIYNDANGTLEGNSPFQTAWLGDEEHEQFLERIARLADERGVRTPEPVVFEGNIPADPSRNAAFRELIEGPEEQVVTAPHIWLGEAVAITGPTSVSFRNQSGSNLLIVGQSGNTTAGILANALIALAVQARNSAEQVDGQADRLWLFHATPADANSARRWRQVVDALPAPVRLAGPDEAGTAIGEIAAEVARRQQEAGAAPPIFLLIDDLSRFRDLRKSDDDFGFGGFDREKAVSPGQQFAEILREGPAVGVHAIVWCDSYNNADRWFSRQSLREFEMRVVFQMSAADSSNLIDSPAASRLGVNRALLYSDERGTLEKFRPYGPPSEAWLRQVRDATKISPGNPEPAEPDYADDVDLWTVI
jgi:hypothetical protein